MCVFVCVYVYMCVFVCVCVFYNLYYTPRTGISSHFNPPMYKTYIYITCSIYTQPDMCTAYICNHMYICSG